MYIDNKGNRIKGTPIRVAEALLDVARKYPTKQVQLFFNDYDTRKIEELKNTFQKMNVIIRL